MLDQPPAWVADAIFYQVFPDRFARSGRVDAPGPLEPWDAPPTVHGFKGGDLFGVAERIDHLVALGVNAIYLNPVFASASNHRYHTYDYLAVDPLLGGEAALRELLDTAHANRIRVILDGVFNHASRGFWPFHHVLETGRHSPYREWFHLNQRQLEEELQLRAYPDPTLAGPVEAEWAAAHGAGTASLETLGYRAWWDLPALPKLNTDNPAVREYLMGVAEHWIRFGVDGWRLDVPREITTPGFWEEFRTRVRAVNPEAYIVGEIWQLRGDLIDGTTFDGLMNYPLAAAITSFVTGHHLSMEVVRQHGELERHIRAEDAATFLLRVTAAVSAYRPAFARSVLNLIGSHDTPRIRSLAGGDVGSVRLALLAMLTMPGAPCIYYGDEIGMIGEMDPGSRGAFPWNDADWDHELFEFVCALTRVRSASPELRSADWRGLAAEGMAAAYLRGDGSTGSVIVAINAGDEPSSLKVDWPHGPVQPVALPGVMAESRRSGAILEIDLAQRNGALFAVA